MARNDDGVVAEYCLFAQSKEYDSFLHYNHRL